MNCFLGSAEDLEGLDEEEMLMRAIAKRVLRRSLSRVDDLMSLLALNPTNDKNVDAEDRAAQMIPAIKTAPR